MPANLDNAQSMREIQATANSEKCIIIKNSQGNEIINLQSESNENGFIELSKADGTSQLYFNANWYSQIGKWLVIGDSGAEASAILILNTTTRGFLPPRMTTAEKNAISSPAEGLIVHDTTLNRPCFYDGAAWVTL